VSRRGAGGAELGMAAANRRARRLFESFGFRLQEVRMARRLPQCGACTDRPLRGR
jgi:hypothetical protein